MKKNLLFTICVVLCIVIILVLIISYGYKKFNFIAGLVIFAVMLATIIRICTLKNFKVENIFLCVVPVILLMFLIFIPSLKNPDEIVHWYRIYDMTQGNLITEMKDGHGLGNLPKSTCIDIPQSDINYAMLGNLYEREIDVNEEKELVNISTAALYNPICYAPQAIGTVLANIFTDKPLIMMYSARLVNLIISLAIIYIAIKIIPYGKRIMLFLTCIPVAASSFASMSPDAMTISMSFLLIAYILKLLNEKEKKIELKDKILIRNCFSNNCVMQNSIFTTSWSNIAFTKGKV